MADSIHVLVAERSRSLAGLLVRHLEESNLLVEVAATVEGALEAAKARAPEVVLSSVSRFDGELLCRKVRALDRSLPVALLYPPNRSDDCERRARRVGADLAIVGPVRKGPLASAVHLLMRLGRQARQLEGQAGKPLSVELNDALVSFKRTLSQEIRKSRRHRYPASFLMLEVDDLPRRAAHLEPRARARLLGAIQLELTQCLRDIDLCAHAGNERFVVFLPHTASDGARAVATRLHARVKSMAELPLSASVGAAAFDGQGEVSYGSLLRGATLALKRAKQAGGDRVESVEPKRLERIFIA